VTLTAVNILLTFVRILQFFTFSRKLSTFTDILESAKFDIFFFILMFTLVTFGYACAGYALFGSRVEKFSSILLSFLTLLRMIKADYNYSDMYKADSSVSGIYFVTF
jgi:hypothetical protein